jgi:hypothetical protein
VRADEHAGTRAHAGVVSGLRYGISIDLEMLIPMHAISISLFM